jgi:hypothetical protein
MMPSELLATNMTQQLLQLNKPFNPRYDHLSWDQVGSVGGQTFHEKSDFT